MNKKLFTMLSVAACVGAASAQNLAPNPSFETSGPGFVPVDQWANFGTNVLVFENGDSFPGGTFAAQDGTRAMQFQSGMAGLNNQSDTVLDVDVNNDGITDLLPVTVGTTYKVGGWIYMPSAAPLEERVGSNGTLDRYGCSWYAIFDIKDANGDRTERVRHALFEGREGRTDTYVPPTDVWTPWEFEITAPENSVEGQFVFVMVSYGDSPGVGYIDNVYVMPVADCPCDMNSDDTLNLDDLDAFIAAFLASDAAADLDGNGSINLDDLDVFIDCFLAGC